MHAELQCKDVPCVDFAWRSQATARLFALESVVLRTHAFMHITQGEWVFVVHIQEACQPARVPVFCFGTRKCGARFATLVCMLQLEAANGMHELQVSVHASKLSAFGRHGHGGELAGGPQKASIVCDRI